MAGLLDPENRNALVQGLLGFGGGILANNTGHYGQFGPAAGAGVNAFTRNFYGQMQQDKDNAFRAQQLAMMEKLQKSQIAENEAQARWREEEARRRSRELEDLNFDRGLVTGFPGSTGFVPQQAPAGSIPPIFPQG